MSKGKSQECNLLCVRMNYIIIRAPRLPQAGNLPLTCSVVLPHYPV